MTAATRRPPGPREYVRYRGARGPVAEISGTLRVEHAAYLSSLDDARIAKDLVPRHRRLQPGGPAYSALQAWPACDGQPVIASQTSSGIVREKSVGMPQLVQGQ